MFKNYKIDKGKHRFKNRNRKNKMYKCEKCKEQSEPYEPQATIPHYRKDGSIEKIEKVCFGCKRLSK